MYHKEKRKSSKKEPKSFSTFGFFVFLVKLLGVIGEELGRNDLGIDSCLFHVLRESINVSQSQLANGGFSSSVSSAYEVVAGGYIPYSSCVSYAGREI